jgi:hypothetical protein
MRQKIIAFIRSTNLEAVIWILGLSYLAIFNPIADHHFTICPIKNLGFSFCPGCGLGESISHLFRFELRESFISHPLGIIALPILVYRVIFLISKSFHNYQNDFSQTIGVKNNG